MLTSGGSAPAPSADALRAQAQEDYGRLPLRFEINRGQTDRQVDFIARGAGYSLFLTPRESVIALSSAASETGTRRAVLRMRLLGAAPHATATGRRQLPGQTNYLRGSDPKSWTTGVTSFAEARYAGVYPGIDLL